MIYKQVEVSEVRSLMIWASNELRILKKGRQIKALKVTLEDSGTIIRLSSS